jgi:hypothetical protein
MCDPPTATAIHGSRGRFTLARDGSAPGGVERDVTFEEPGPEVHAGVDAAYHAKYDRYGPGPVGSVVTAEAVRSTLRVVPR